MSAGRRTRVRSTRCGFGDRWRFMVLALLSLSSFFQLPVIATVIEPGLPEGKLSVECGDCCGSNCQCSGGCCSDSHVVRTDAGRSLRDRDGSMVSATVEMKRRNDCRGGKALSTAFSVYHPFLGPEGRTRIEPPTKQNPHSGTAGCRWSRPDFSRSNSRGPPCGGGRNTLRLINTTLHRPA